MKRVRGRHILLLILFLLGVVLLLNIQRIKAMFYEKKLEDIYGVDFEYVKKQRNGYVFRETGNKDVAFLYNGKWDTYMKRKISVEISGVIKKNLENMDNSKGVYVYVEPEYLLSFKKNDTMNSVLSANTDVPWRVYIFTENLGLLDRVNIQNLVLGLNMAVAYVGMYEMDVYRAHLYLSTTDSIYYDFQSSMDISEYRIIDNH